MEQQFQGTLKALIETIRSQTQRLALAAIVTAQLPRGTALIHEPCIGRIHVQNGNITYCIIVSNSGRNIRGHEALQRLRAITHWTYELLPANTSLPQHPTQSLPAQYSPIQFSPSQYSPPLNNNNIQNSPSLPTVPPYQNHNPTSPIPRISPHHTHSQPLPAVSPHTQKLPTPGSHSPPNNPRHPSHIYNSNPNSNQNPHMQSNHGLSNSQLMPAITSTTTPTHATTTSAGFPIFPAYIPKQRQHIPPALLSQMQVNESRLIRMVYTLVNGQRTIAQIKEQVRLAPELVDRILYELLRLQLIE